MSEYFCVRMAGGDERALFCNPARAVESIRLMYPQALAVTEISKVEFLALCDRYHRVTMA